MAKITDGAASELLAAFSMRINTRQLADHVMWSAIFFVRKTFLKIFKKVLILG